MSREIELRLKGGLIEIRFNFDQWLVDNIKRVQSREFDPKRKLWTVPVSCADILDGMLAWLAKSGVKVTGDVDLKGLRARGDILMTAPRAKNLDELHPAVVEMYRQMVTNSSSFYARRTPREHQEAAIAWLTFAGSGLVADQPGLGKTKIAIDYGRLRLAAGDVSRVVMVVPATLKRMWSREIEVDSGERTMTGVVCVIEGNPRQRLMVEDLAMTKARWVIYNYEQVRTSTIFPELCKGALVVLDEAHRALNAKSQQGEVIAMVAPTARYFVTLTGTPVVNQSLDAFAMSQLTHPGLLGVDKFGFAKVYGKITEKMVPVKAKRDAAGVITEKGGLKKRHDIGSAEKGSAASSALAERMRRVMLRRTKAECVDLPPKVWTRHDIELGVDQSRAYCDLVEKLRAEILTPTGDKFQARAKQASLLVRLAQTCDGFLPDQGGEPRFFQDIPKYDRLDELVQEVCAAGGKFVIWSRFVPPIYWMLDRYRSLGAVAIHGAVKKDDRMSVVDRFQNDPECQVIIGQLHTMGVGLTLTAAEDEAFISRWWSPAVNEQCEDRLHRLGQEAKRSGQVNIHLLISQSTPEMVQRLGQGATKFNTAEQVQSYVLDSKQAIADNVTGDDAVDTDIRRLGEREIRAIAGL